VIEKKESLLRKRRRKKGDVILERGIND